METRPPDAVVPAPTVTAIDPAAVTERGGLIIDAVRRTTEMLAAESSSRDAPLPLIGFAGAPFTLAAYLVEGGPSKDHLAARRLIHEDPAGWDALTQWLADISGRFLALQIEAGASAGQLFDSWAGSLSPRLYRQAALPASARALAHVREIEPPAGSGMPRIPLSHFGVGTGDLLADIASLDLDVVGIDHRIDLDEALERVGREVTVQGNLDPAMLFAPAEVRAREVSRIVAAGEAARAHVFNLGHGVPPETDPDVLTALVTMVHDAR